MHFTLGLARNETGRPRTHYPEEVEARRKGRQEGRRMDEVEVPKKGRVRERTTLVNERGRDAPSQVKSGTRVWERVPGGTGLSWRRR